MLKPDQFIFFAIPVFLIFIVLEIIICQIQKNKFVHFPDAFSNLSCGLSQQLLLVFFKLLLLPAYLLVYQFTSLFSFSLTSPSHWIFLFFGQEFLHYWLHRFGHQWSLIWLSHIVHHQSEELNLTVGLRQAWLEPVFGMIFYLPLAVLGFPLTMTLTIIFINSFYQFWIHTRLIGKLGFLESFLNTPSHHRVHHGKSIKYRNKNYGGVLIVWDKWFGTFQVEEEEPKYGIATSLKSWNPILANLQYWKYFWIFMKNNSWKNNFQFFFQHPYWNPKK